MIGRILLKNKTLFFFFILSLAFGFSKIFAQTFELSANDGILKIKLDLTRGGAISYISLSGSSRSLVNIHDNGRYIQQSYYAGKRVDRRAEGQNPSWSPWSWNPVQAGDSYGNRSKVLDYRQNGDTLYVKSIPMLWDMNNMPAEAEMEQWTILKGNVIEVHNKLTCHRTDNIYGENISDSQELPAVYPISALKNLYTYLGNSPFKNDTVDNPPVVNLSSGFWGRYPNVSEHWMAFVDNNKWGIGVYNPNSTYFIAGMAGSPGGEAYSSSTSYIAPTRREILNKNCVFEYNYDLIVGTVNEIRQFVYQVGHADTYPCYGMGFLKKYGRMELTTKPQRHSCKRYIYTGCNRSRSIYDLT